MHVLMLDAIYMYFIDYFEFLVLLLSDYFGLVYYTQ